MRIAACSVLALGLIAAACAPKPQQVRIDGMLSEARANEVAAMKRYEGKRLLVRAVVAEVGMANHETAVATWNQWGGATARMKNEQTPFAILQSSAGGQLLCYFAKGRDDDAAELVRGQPARLTGKFQQYYVTPQGQQRVVLAGCELADP